MIAESSLSILRISIADMMDLRVRAKGSRQDALPELLYQRLPIDAMSIMSTIPRGSSAVSIPHQNVFGCKYGISRTLPSGNGFVIVYARQPNNRYEAVSVLFRGKKVSIAEFHDEACQWINRRKGRLEPIPGRYAYFAPVRDQWAVILRDSGYAVLDPSRIPEAIAPELFDDGKSAKGEIVIRVPIYAGQKQPQDSMLPVFVQVEPTADPRPNSRSLWISFVEYQKARAFRSHPPAPIVSDFLEWLALLTEKCGFKSWIFRPGMYFGDRVEWWGDGNRRRTEHEGVDFAEGLQSGAVARCIPELTPICAVADGDVVAILDDFLGKTVVMRHRAITQESGDVFYTFLSHIQPASEKLGPVTIGQFIGRVNNSANTGAPAHLHLSGAWIPEAIQPGTITLDHLHPANTSVTLINFNDLLNSSPLCVNAASHDA